MKVDTYADAESFLSNTRVELESNEVANSLMLGICLRAIRSPERVRTPPLMKTVKDERGLVLAAVMTPPHKLVVYGHQGELDEGARVLAANLVDEGWGIPGVLGPREVAKEVADGWAEITGQRWDLVGQQRVYELREMAKPVPEGGRLRLATATDAELVAGWRFEFCLEILGEADREEARRVAALCMENGDIYLWEDEGPVSVAMRSRPTRNGVSVSFVYTPPELRGRGYATACVRELSRLLLASGWGYCALFGDVTNVAASRVYQKIGYRPVSDYDEYVFLDIG